METDEATLQGRSGIHRGDSSSTAEELTALARSLRREGSRVLATLPARRLQAAWDDTVSAFLDPDSVERRRTDAAVARGCRLSRPGLAAAYDAVLGGMRHEEAARVLASRRRGGAGVTLVILASNPPPLASQLLLPALALGRPLLFKSASAEPVFTPAFLAALAQREPGLSQVAAAVAWRGGASRLEIPLLAEVDRVVAYGGTAALADLGTRAGEKLVRFGPKLSLAVVDRSAEPEVVAPALARDVALLDQRGCLCVHAVLTAGDPHRLAVALEEALARLAVDLPPGPFEPDQAAAVQQLRGEAQLRGLFLSRLPVGSGTVVVDPDPELRPSPGLRTVRVCPLEDLGKLPDLLAPWRGRLQGAALAGPGAWRFGPMLESLGVCRLAPPGELQHTPATWHNGGVDPAEVLVGPDP